MFNLIKNELIKIFSKKAIYVILIIFLLLSIAGMVLNKVIGNINNAGYNYIDQEISILKESLKQVNKATEEGKEEYSYLQSHIEYLELQKKYGANSWQSTIISNELYDKIINLNYYKNGLVEYVKENDVTLEELQNEYDDIIKKLDEGDWKAFAETDLAKIKTQLEFTENEIRRDMDTDTLNALKQEAEVLKLKLQVLEWRLQKDICYGDKDYDMLLTQYEANGSILINNNYVYDIDENNYKEKEGKDYKYSDKKQYQETLAEYNIAKYKIENNISSKTTVSEALQTLFTNGGEGLLFVIIISLMLTGGIVSEEFNKGTIKLLLIRPYSRRKILASKIIACFITIVFSILIITIIQTIFSGIMYGFDTINAPIIEYNYNTNTVVSVNGIVSMLIGLLQMSPLVIILSLIAFMIGTICANTAVAIVVSFLAYFVSSIVNSLVMEFQIKWLKIVPTLNWDLTQYTYGKLPTVEGMTLGFSILICAITIISLLVITFENFARKNIKNV